MKLKALLKKLEECSDIQDLKDFCNQYGLCGFMDSYMNDREALGYIKDTCDSMSRLYYCTQEIEDWDADWFHLDVYSNLENVQTSFSDLKEMVAEELKKRND